MDKSYELKPSTTPSHEHQQTEGGILNERELLQQYEANLKVKEALDIKQQVLDIKQEALNIKQEALISKQEQFDQVKEQFESQMKQREFQFEFQMKQRQGQFETMIMMKQREAEFDIRLVVPGPACVMLSVVGNEHNQNEEHNEFLLHQEQQLLAKLTNNDNNDNIILGKQLKLIAASVQNKYDDALRLLDEVNKREASLVAEKATMEASLVIERATMEVSLADQRAAMEAKLETRLDIPADMDLEQLRDWLFKHLPIVKTLQSSKLKLGRDTILHIAGKLSDQDFSNVQPYLSHLLKLDLSSEQIDHIITEFRIEKDRSHLQSKILVLELCRDKHNNDNNYATMVNTIVHQDKNDLESSQLYCILLLRLNYVLSSLS